MAAHVLLPAAESILEVEQFDCELVAEGFTISIPVHRKVQTATPLSFHF
jgi:hypothetical protein